MQIGNLVRTAFASLALALLGAASTFAEQPQYGGTLTVALPNDGKSLDPTFQINFSERQPLYLIFNTLVGLGPDFGIVPELA